MSNQLRTDLTTPPAESDDDPVKQLELEVARRRERLSTTLSTLRTEIQGVQEWRHWYDRHPLVFLGGAALAGWVAGQILFPRRS
jgi:hypothetical protein